MTQKRLEANRRNALKSTGPKTPAGKAASSRNAIKHGVLSASPVIQGIESQEEWERHLNGFLKSLAPVGYLEELLTVQLAEILWKLWRISRYQAEVAAADVAAAELDLEERAKPGCGKPSDPARPRAWAADASLIVETLGTLPNMTDEEKLERKAVPAMLWAFIQELPDHLKDRPFPNFLRVDPTFNWFDDWTAGHLRSMAQAFAAAAQITPEALLNKCIESADKKYHQANEKERELVDRGRRWKLGLEREIRRRMLLEPSVLATVVRYESNLERAFVRTLHELQRLQASRSGIVVPPPATMDVDLTVHTEGSSGVNLRKHMRSREHGRKLRHVLESSGSDPSKPSSAPRASENSRVPMASKTDSTTPSSDVDSPIRQTK